jgi:hypothetical protein
MKAEILQDPINRLQSALLFVCFSLCFLSRSENAQKKFTPAKKKELKYKREKKLTMITFVSRDFVVAVQVVSSSGDLYY